MLQIRLLGGLEVEDGRGERLTLVTQASRCLLAFLALNAGRRFHRERLAGLLWGERSDEAARKMLRNSLWRLRRALEESTGQSPVGVEGQDISLLSDTWVDIQQLRQTCRMLRKSEDQRFTDGQVESLRGAVDLYRGDLLEGMYEEWAMGPREEIRLAFLNALERLFNHYAATGDLHAAVATARTLLRHNPFLEHVHRDLMLCHCAMGDRPLAVRQYEHCREVLRDELGLDPMDETRELHQRILSGSIPRAADTPTRWGSLPLAPRQRPVRSFRLSSDAS